MKIYASKLTPGFYVEGISNIPDDAYEIGAELWNELLEGQTEGKTIDFTSTPPVLIEYVKTEEDYMAEAEAIRSQLRITADTEIAWRQDAVDAGIATEQEAAELAEWKKYRVLLMRVDTTKPVWPTVPGEQAS
ncbi:tail fiber assembly protein [Citrobacter koseri]|uniref:Tail fiber assembly protein n=1 Tax=Citrobacter koseri TaxID=545 RepID=A0AAQ0VBT6_CITKO|nr:tail fiber assembly protein [Citrobacter koseri]EJK7984195.1 tail fiber assembly protein [Citrobacter koseri]MDU3230064.1 tail fiber assembly protein [Citrobacter koseri]RSC18803.1 tail fiber assembly protein [Citrobacter koseri]HAT3696912.1 tail fiber assembly protein [Citrobacter koseri]